MPWFRRSDGSIKPGEEHDEEIEFKPEKLKEDITTDLTNKFGEFQTANDKKLEPVLEFITSFKADKEARDAAARKVQENKNNEQNELTEEDYLLDPIAATRRAMEPTQKALINIASRQLRTELLGEDPFYYGDIKNKVDAMIDAQNVNVRTDPNVIRNCFKLVMYDHQKDIQDGKIKARNTGAIFETNGTGAPSGTDKNEDNESWTKDEEVAAGHMGINKKDWIASRRELSYV